MVSILRRELGWPFLPDVEAAGWDIAVEAESAMWRSPDWSSWRRAKRVERKIS
jgi:hypothetical protein